MTKESSPGKFYRGVTNEWRVTLGPTYASSVEFLRESIVSSLDRSLAQVSEFIRERGVINTELSYFPGHSSYPTGTDYERIVLEGHRPMTEEEKKEVVAYDRKNRQEKPRKIATERERALIKFKELKKRYGFSDEY